MAKDPAMLWYWSDWHSGTALLSRFLKGAYMDILHAQFNNGRLSLEDIKTVLGSDFGSCWPALQKKFAKDQHGLFFNERLEQEKLKREAFSESRRQSRLGKTKSHDESHEKRTIQRTENVNENGDLRVRGPGKGWNSNPGEAEMNLELPGLKVGAVIQFFAISKNLQVNSKQVNGLWEVFKAQNFTGEKWYASANQAFSHFINWCKTHDFKPEAILTETVFIPSAREQRGMDLIKSIK